LKQCVQIGKWSAGCLVIYAKLRFNMVADILVLLLLDFCYKYIIH
jgi:hypothetical protein